MYKFNVEKAVNGAVKWIQDWFEEAGKGCNAVLGISGGKDSSVTAALLVKALGKDRVIGVMMPKGEQADINMSKLLISHLGIKSYEINILGAVEGLEKELKAQEFTYTDQARINLAPRIRMSTVYAVSQCNNGRVANTCNLSEDWVGYNTRYGDGAGDFSPLSKLTVAEVRALGVELGLPNELVFKVPIDGLTPLTDEENLGFTYDALEKYIRTGVCDDPETKEKIDRKHAANLFKLEWMPVFEHDGPIKA